MRFSFLNAIIVLFINLFSIYSSLAFADIVYLKNGQKIEGRIIDESDEYVKLKIKIGETKIKKTDIESIEKKDLPEGFFDDTEAQNADKSSEKVSESSEEKEITYEINVEAKVFEENNKYVVEIDGNSNFPEGSLIYVFFKKVDRYITSLEVPVKENKIFVRFGPFEKPLPFGEYIINAVFKRRRQPENIIKSLGEFQVQTVSGSYIFSIGSQEEIKNTKEQSISEIRSAVIELEILYDELNKYYNENIIRFDSLSWNNWSNDWSKRLENLKGETQLRIDKYLISVSPEEDSIIMDTIEVLSSLHNKYLRKFKDPEYVKIFDDPNFKEYLKELNDWVLSNLNKIKYI